MSFTKFTLHKKTREMKHFAFAITVLVLTMSVLSCQDSTTSNQETDWKIIVQPNSDYILKGDTFKANLLLTKELPADAKIHFEEDSSLFEPRDERIQYSIKRKADGETGIRKLEGNVVIEEGKETIKLPFYYEYTVAPFSACVQNRYLIQGIKNPIEVSVPGISPNYQKVEVSQGEVVQEGFTYYVIPRDKGELKLKVEVQMPNGKTQELFHLFEVK